VVIGPQRLEERGFLIRPQLADALLRLRQQVTTPFDGRQRQAPDEAGTGEHPTQRLRHRPVDGRGSNSASPPFGDEAGDLLGRDSGERRRLADVAR
jgi:hypothetical protein